MPKERLPFMNDSDRDICVSISAKAKFRLLTKEELQYLLLLVLSDGKKHKMNVLYLCLEGISKGKLPAEDVVLAHHGSQATASGGCEMCELGNGVIQKSAQEIDD
jgi:hypothetical protein